MSNKLIKYVKGIKGSIYKPKENNKKLTFPERLHIDIEIRKYLTSKVNAIFNEKLVFTMDTGEIKKTPHQI